MGLKVTDSTAVRRRIAAQMRPENRLQALIAGPGEHTRPLQFYGNNAYFQTLTEDKMLAGPADTGKSLACIYQLHQWCLEYPGFQAAIIRKTYKSMPSTVLQSFEKKILPKRHGINIYGGKKPERYIYHNDSVIWVAGLDNPDRILSSEFDAIYVNQAEELTVAEWETLTTRTTGRAGNAPFALTFGDCNPGNQYHWILEKKREGTLDFVESRHRDNPELYDPETGNITPEGEQRIGRLDKLTGLRHKRLRLGLWVAAEGQVYEFDPEIHVVYPADVPQFVNRYRVIDFGYTNPFVCQWWGQDSNGRLYLYREIYMTGRTVKQHAGDIKRLSAGEVYRATIADHDAEDRATLRESMIDTIAADKRVKVGIEKTQERLKLAGDKRPRLYVVAGALIELDQSLAEQYKPTCTEQEFPGYIYPTPKSGRNADEQPIKEDDHGMDCVRYMCMFLDGRVRREARSYQG